MSVGSINYQGASLPFLAAQTPVGMVQDRALDQAEELMTPGVNGRRWRTLFAQYPSFEMRTFHEATNYAVGIGMKRTAENLTQKLVRLNVTISTTTYAYIDIHVSAVLATVHPGPIVGAGAGSGTSHVEILWQLEMTSDTAQ